MFVCLNEVVSCFHYFIMGGLKQYLIPAVVLTSILTLTGLAIWKNTRGGPSGQVTGEQQTAAGLKEAKYYEVLEGGRVRCNLCPNHCILEPGQRGVCKVRQNIDGKLYSLVYGKPVAIHLDPIEKKPFFHVLPSSKIYSLATAGCNLACKYCQNWDIAQRFPEDVKYREMSPEEIVTEAQSAEAGGIAFTYSEPTVFYEYMLDIAKLAQKEGLKTVVVSAGFINPKPLKELLPHIDAYKIDLKAFSNEVYQDLIGGKMDPILDTLKIIDEDPSTWLEIVNLLVPGYNDNLEEIKKMCIWIKDNLGTEVPVHFSRFHPTYKLQNLPPTPEETVKKARRICLEAGLNYVYTGNIPDEEGFTTYCPICGKPIIVRKGYTVTENHIDNGKCEYCGAKIPGVWE